MGHEKRRNVIKWSISTYAYYFTKSVKVSFFIDYGIFFAIHRFFIEKKWYLCNVFANKVDVLAFILRQHERRDGWT